MAIQKFQFSRLWTNPSDFPSYEPSEAQVRADMQELHDQTKDYINNNILGAVDSEIENMKEWVVDTVAGVALSQIPDLSVGTGKLADGAVTRAKLAAGLAAPQVAQADEGKFMRVVNGAWAAVSLTDAGQEEY